LTSNPPSTSPSLLAAVGAVILLGSSTPARAEIVERIVAVVNDQIVLLSDLQQRVREYGPQLDRIQDPTMRQQQLELLRRRELERLVDNVLIEEEGIKLKLEVSSAELDQAVESVLKQNNVTRAEMIATLEQEGYAFSQYRVDLRRQILRLKTINMAVRSRVSVSADEIRAHYQASVTKLGVGLQLRLSQIFLRVDRSGSGGDDSERRLAEARRYTADLGAGRLDFATLARRVSDDADTKATGGALGWMSRGKLPPLVEEAVFAVSGTHRVVGPVVTENGLYLMYVHERKESEALPFDQVKDQLKAKLFNLRAAKRTEAWVKSLRQRALIDVRP
jgi:peptidyl-prolyl cis-trans isomerase SurA